MMKYLSAAEEILYTNYKHFLKQEVGKYVTAIDQIINELIAAFKRDKNSLTDGEIDYICKNVVLKIFSLRAYRDIEIAFTNVSLDIDNKYFDNMDCYWKKPSHNIALLAIKVIFKEGKFI